jgi:hypothetical protein
MKRNLFVLLVALFGFLALAGPASAQTAGQVFCGPAIGYADVCPADVVRPLEDDGAVAADTTGTLPRTGSDNSVPMARIAIVLIGVGGALTIMAGRRRLAHVAT